MQPFYQSPLAGETPYHVSCGTTVSFGAHWHGEIELIYVLSGEAFVHVEGKAYTIPAGAAAWIGSAEIHSLDSSSPGARILVIEMGYRLLGNTFSAFTGRTFVEKVRRIPLQSSLHQILSSIRDAADMAAVAANERDKTAWDCRLRSHLLMLAAMLLTEIEMADVGERRRRQRACLLSMQQALEYVDEHFAQPITVEQMAQKCGYEKTRFCQLFKRALGTTFHTYLNARRIEAAQALLRGTSLPIRTVANDTGFPEAKTFSRVFRAAVGVTPQTYRQTQTPADTGSAPQESPRL